MAALSPVCRTMSVCPGRRSAGRPRHRASLPATTGEMTALMDSDRPGPDHSQMMDRVMSPPPLSDSSTDCPGGFDMAGSEPSARLEG